MLCIDTHARLRAELKLYTNSVSSLTQPLVWQVNYGLLTRNLVQSLIELGGDVQLLSTVTALQQQADKSWLVSVKKNDLTQNEQVQIPSPKP